LIYRNSILFLCEKKFKMAQQRGSYFFMKSTHSDHGHGDGHEHTLYNELICHLPYAIASVAFSLSIVAFLAYFSLVQGIPAKLICRGSRVLFHSFHFMHLVFATTGALITYCRFSKNRWHALLVGIFVPPLFCILSDAILPYFAGRFLGVPMHFHLCFKTELHNVLPFLFVGVVNGLIMSKHHSSKQLVFSLYSHFVHILVSSFASVFYLIAHGCTNWYDDIGLVFLFLIIAVVIPCTLSDVVVPMLFAKAGMSNEKH